MLSVRQETTRLSHQNRVTIHYLTLKAQKWSAGDILRIEVQFAGEHKQALENGRVFYLKAWPSLQHEKDTLFISENLFAPNEEVTLIQAKRVSSANAVAALPATKELICTLPSNDLSVQQQDTLLPLWKEILCTPSFTLTGEEEFTDGTLMVR